MDHSSVVSGGIVRLVRARLYYPRLMSRPFEKVTLSDAVGRLRPGMKVLLPAGCGDPAALFAEIIRQSDRLAPLTLMGGLRLDDFAFAGPEHAGKLRFATWHRSQIDCWAEASHALAEYAPTPIGDVERRIAERVADLIPDGSTVQVGVGSIPQAVMEALAGKRDLGVHSLLVDHMLPLIESGV